MNINEFKEKYPEYKDTDDQVLADKLYTKYYSDRPKDQFISAFLGDKSVQQTQSNVIPRTIPQRLAEYAKAGAGATLGAMTQPLSRPVLEMGGMAAGEALGGGPITGNIGGGLGYATGRQAADLLEHAEGSKEPYTLKGQALKAAVDVPSGMLMGAAGKVLEKGLAAGIDKVGEMAPRIYEKMIKMPNAMSRLARGKVTSTALKEEIPVTEAGLDKLQATTKEIQNQVNSIIDAGNKEGKGVSARKVIANLDDARKKYANNPLADEYIKDIDELEGKLRAKYINEKTGEDLIPVAEAQKIKQSTYKMLKSHYEKSAKGVLGAGDLKDSQVQGLESFARGLKEQIVEQFPVLKNLNARDGALLDLEKYLTKAVNRIHNRELGGIALDFAAPVIGGGIGGVEGGRQGGAGGALGGIGAGAAVGMGITRAMRNPAFMSRLAFAMRKASKLSSNPGIGVATKGLTYRVGKSGILDPASNASAAETQDTSPASPAIRSAMAAYSKNPPDYQGTIQSLTEAMRRDPSRREALQNQIQKVMYEMKQVKRFQPTVNNPVMSSNLDHPMSSNSSISGFAPSSEAGMIDNSPGFPGVDRSLPVPGKNASLQKGLQLYRQDKLGEALRVLQEAKRKGIKDQNIQIYIQRIKNKIKYYEDRGINVE